MSLYARRGVSAQKEDVHKATEKLNKGLYPYAFCQIFPDFLGNNAEWVNLMHADGAGTKSILAYLYWKQTGDVTVWKGIARDAIVMNLDDLLCVGAYDNFLFSSTIDRNRRNIPEEVLTAIIDGSREFFEELENLGVHVHYLGGETADVGDLVRTIAVNGTMAVRMKKVKLITNQNIKSGNVIIGVASDGKADYEAEYNSGIGSNGLTSARHDLLSREYAIHFQESYDDLLREDIAYIGKYGLTDQIAVNYNGVHINTSVGKLLLSPTRTYAPLMKLILERNFHSISGLIHCSGGGQTKCMKYLPGNLRVIKDDMFEPPPVFRLIQQSSGSDDREMYQVFNMGHRLEIFTEKSAADDLIAQAKAFGLSAKIVGRVENAARKELILWIKEKEIIY